MSPLRLLFELAAAVGRDRFLDAAEDMWHQQLFNPADARDFLAEVRRQGRTGVVVMEEWLDRVGDEVRPTMSGLETGLSLALERIGMPKPRRQYLLTLDNGIEIHFDLAYPEARLGLEPGGSWWHGGDRGVRSDYERDAWCAAKRWQTLRFDEVQLQNLALCARQVSTVYRARLSEFGRPLDS